MTDPRSTPSIPVAPEHRRQSMNGCVTCSKKWRDHTLAEAMPLTHGEARPTPVEPEARLAAKIEQTSRIRDALQGCESMGAFDNWLIEELSELRASATIPDRRLAVEPDGLPLDVAVAALREITRTVYSDDAPLNSPSYSSLHLKAVGIAREALARLASTPSEANRDESTRFRY